MPSVIDTLLIEIGLDAAKFRPGMDAAVRASAKMRDETTKHAKEIQKAFGEELSGAFEKVTTKVVAFLAVMVGARSIEQFTANVTKSGVALGIMASALGSTPERLSAIGLAVERLGGSSESAWGSIKKLNDVRIAFQSWGTAPPEWFLRLGINLSRGVATSGEDVLNQAVRALERSNYSFDQKRHIMEQLGVDPFTAQLYLQGGAQGAIAAASRDAWTAAQVKAAQNLYDAWERASQSAIAMGRAIEERIEPALSAVLKWLADVINENQQLVANWAGDRIRDALSWLGKINWKQIGTDVSDAARQFNTLVTSTLGWKLALEGLFGLWMIGKVNPAIQIIGTLTSAILALSAAAETWLGLRIAVIAALAAPLVLTGDTDPLAEAGKEQTTAEWLKKWLWGEDKPKPPAVHEDWMAHVARQGGVPILVGGAPVSEGTPMPVKIVGPSSGSVSPSPPPDTTPKFAQGGSFVVGGQEGQDANRITLDLTKGERVDITPAHQRYPYQLKLEDTGPAVINAVAGEGGSSRAGMDAVLNVLFNRLGSRAYGSGGGLKDVVSAQGQFDAYTRGVKASVDQYAYIRRRIIEMASGRLSDPTGGAMEFRSGSAYDIAKKFHPEGMDVGGNWLFQRPGASAGPYGAFERNNSALLMGGARVGASMHAASLPQRINQSSTSVTISGMSFVNAGKGSARDALAERLSRELYVLRSDVGLA